MRKHLRGTIFFMMRRTIAMTTTSSVLSSPPRRPMQLFYNDIWEVPLPEKHKFPMEKYKFVRKRLQSILQPGKLGVFHPSPLASVIDLETTHCSNYIRRFVEGRFTEKENKAVGFPWSPQSVNRALSSVGGTIAATHSVCRDECLVSAHIAGGTHHAFFDYGEGFCVFSDIAVAAHVALRDYPTKIRKVLIIDLDVHQGNGNAALFHDDPNVFTFSMHCRQNIFSERKYSNYDVEVEAGCGDGEYLRLLDEHLPAVLDQSEPDIVFFQAGVDPGQFDRLGRLNVTAEGLRSRNEYIYAAVVGSRLAAGQSHLKNGMRPLNVPLVVTMGGGYPKDLNPSSSDFRNVVYSHSDVYVGAARAAALAHT